MAIAAFVIDCDGTLVDTEPLWDLAKQEVTERWGGSWGSALPASLAGVALGATAHRISELEGRSAAEHSVAEDLLGAFWVRLTAAPVIALASTVTGTSRYMPPKPPTAVLRGSQITASRTAARVAAPRPLSLCRPAGERRQSHDLAKGSQ